jgi:hypothetical protein
MTLSKTSLLVVLSLAFGSAMARPFLSDECGAFYSRRDVDSCCANKAKTGVADASCPEASPPAERPFVGGECGAFYDTRDISTCCAIKTRVGIDDATCPSCFDVASDDIAACCAEKATAGTPDRACEEPRASPPSTDEHPPASAPAPAPAESEPEYECASKAIGDIPACCAQKAVDGVRDASCDALRAPDCGSLGRGGLYSCCVEKVNLGISDPSCIVY